MEAVLQDNVSFETYVRARLLEGGISTWDNVLALIQKVSLETVGILDDGIQKLRAARCNLDADVLFAVTAEREIGKIGSADVERLTITLFSFRQF